MHVLQVEAEFGRRSKAMLTSLEERIMERMIDTVGNM